MVVRSVSLKFASTQLSPLTTRLRTVDRRRHRLADDQPVGLGDRAGLRRGDGGVGEVERGLIAARQRRQHRRVVVGLDGGVAAERGERRDLLLLRLLQRLFGVVQVLLGLIVGRLRGDALGEQALLAVEGLLVEGDVVGGGLDGGFRRALRRRASGRPEGGRRRARRRRRRARCDRAPGRRRRACRRPSPSGSRGPAPRRCGPTRAERR